MVAARSYLRVRKVAMRTGLEGGDVVELVKHHLASDVRGVWLTFLYVVAYCRPSVRVEGNWGLLPALGKALCVERRPWILAADLSAPPEGALVSVWVGPALPTPH